MLTNTYRCPLKLYSDNESGDKHCSKCNKTVLDLRHQSDDAVEHLAKESGEFCGIIQSNRLSSSSIGVTALAASILALSSALAPFNHLQAQQPEKVKHVQLDSTRTITGIVSDKETGEPLPFVNVIVKQGKEVICQGSTDFDGVFKISVPLRDINKYQSIDLSASTVGYKVETIHIKLEDLNTSQKLVLESNIDMSTIDVTMGIIMYSPPLLNKYDLSTGATFKAYEIQKMPRN